MIKKEKFNITYPLSLLSNEPVRFNESKQRSKILKRNLFYKSYKNKKNELLVNRSDIYFNLAKEISQLIMKKYPKNNLLSISVFGSSLYSKNSGDLDFLVITSGNLFLLEETALNMGGDKYEVGISIKGIENLSNGNLDPYSDVPPNKQIEILSRTASALFRRHIPLVGLDFLENEQLFNENLNSQICDLISNSYDTYYLRNQGNFGELDRARKLLSRLYEAIAYLGESEVVSDKILKLRRKIFILINSQPKLCEAKSCFRNFLSLCNSLNKFNGVLSND